MYIRFIEMINYKTKIVTIFENIHQLLSDSFKC